MEKGKIGKWEAGSLERRTLQSCTALSFPSGVWKGERQVENGRRQETVNTKPGKRVESYIDKFFSLWFSLPSFYGLTSSSLPLVASVRDDVGLREGREGRRDENIRGVEILGNVWPFRLLQLALSSIGSG